MVRSAGCSVSRSPFDSAFGSFDLWAFEYAGGKECAVLVTGEPWNEEQPLVRVQSACLTGTAFGATLCDCRQQVALALRTISRERAGVFVYAPQEGRGHGLVEKVEQLALISAGRDTFEAAQERGVPQDPRAYDDVVDAIYSILESGSAVRLLTNNPEKLSRLRASGLAVSSRVPLESEPTLENRRYLEWKKARLGHLLDSV